MLTEANLVATEKTRKMAAIAAKAGSARPVGPGEQQAGTLLLAPLRK